MENKELTRTAEDYLDELRRNHSRAEATALEFLKISIRNGELLTLAKAEIGRGFRAYCERAGIPKTSAYRYMEIYIHKDEIQQRIETQKMTVVQALTSVKRELEKPTEIDITPKVTVIETPPPEPDKLDDDHPIQDSPEQQNLFDSEKHRVTTADNLTEEERKKRDDNNYRARLNTAKKNKCISTEDKTRRLAELDSYILECDTKAESYDTKAEKQRTKKANYEIEKGEVSNYRIK